MGKIKIKRPLADSTKTGGYICRTISKGFLSSTPISVWTHFYHKPYADDWDVARCKAIEHCRNRALTLEGGITNGGTC